MTDTTTSADVEILAELRGKDVASLTGDATPDDLRGKTPDELGQFLEVLDAHLRRCTRPKRASSATRGPTSRRRSTRPRAPRQARHGRIEEHNARSPRCSAAAPQTVSRHTRFRTAPGDGTGDVRRLTNAEARDRALRILDDRGATAHLSDAQKAGGGAARPAGSAPTSPGGSWSPRPTSTARRG